MVSYDTNNKGGNMASTTEIRIFLAQVRKAIDYSNYNILDRRWKYLSTMSQLGLIEQDVMDDIYGLTENEDWVKELDNNPSYPGDVWQCHKNLHGQCIYIKLKIQPHSNGFLLVMSYHIDGM
jgi:hypothetical protein